MGFVEKSKIIMNWAGSIPSPKYGQDAIISTQLSSWNLNKDDGFKIMNYAGEILPAGGGSFISMQGNNFLLYKINDEIYKLELTSL